MPLSLASGYGMRYVYYIALEIPDNCYFYGAVVYYK